MYDLATGVNCPLNPSLPDQRRLSTSETIWDSSVICGGYGEMETTTCITLTPNQWVTSHHLGEGRLEHSSGVIGDSIILFGGRDSPLTSEILTKSDSQPGFQLQYETG